MLQLDAESEVILLAGSSGTGKSTFALRLMVADTEQTCRFFFDYKGEYEKRLQLPAAQTLEELKLAIEDGFCIFDPHTMFCGQLKEAFAWFSEFVFVESSQVPGRKIYFVDEAWKFCSPHAIPQGLADCVQTGRKAGLTMLFATQRPNRLNEAITNEVTELVCFRLQGKKALDTVEELGADRDEVAYLPAGSFVALNCEQGGELRGRFW